jgi:hypothetical protein
MKRFFFMGKSVHRGCTLRATGYGEYNQDDFNCGDFHRVFLATRLYDRFDAQML